MADAALGCDVCRSAIWAGPDAPQRIAVDRTAHETFYRCRVCGTIWSEDERSRVPLEPSAAEARLAEPGVR